jgi:ribulose 1,5-bisphosphate synthetase/thiazole synthase
MTTLMRIGCLLTVMNGVLSVGMAGSEVVSELGAVRESAREIPVAYDVDVVVVGGSSRAVAAAMGAAQQGAEVFLAASRPYLGEDLCSTYRLWLDPDEVPITPLAIALYAEPEVSSYGKNRLPFSYTADLPSAKLHPDTAKPFLLCDGKWHDAPSQSVQYDGDVTITVDVNRTQYIEQASVLVYQRPGDFVVAEAAVQVSTDGQDWQAVGLARNEHMGQGREKQALALIQSVQQQARFVRLVIRRTPGTKRILLAEICIDGRASVDSEQRASRVPPTPMQVKRVLDQALLDTGVQFLYGCYATELLCDGRGEPSGIVITNSAGRQAVKAKVIIDATTNAIVARMGDARFTEREQGLSTFTRIVVGGRRSKPDGSISARKLPAPVAAQAEKLYEAWEYRGKMPWDGLSFPALARIEQGMRNQSWQRGQVDASERVFFVPRQRIVGQAGPCQEWPGARKVDLGICQAKGLARIYVLSGAVNVSSKAAQQMLKPLQAMGLGRRIGAAAATEAAAHAALKGVSVRPNRTQAATVDGDVGDTPGWAPPLDRNLGTVPSPDHYLPIIASYDVVVVGGGTGGAPAGISAARQGAKTLVVEYLHDLGGVGTLGLISKYYHGNRTGFTEEIDRGLADLGGASEGKSGQGQAWDTLLKAEWFRRELHQAGAHVWFGTLGCGAFVDQGKVKGVIVATPAGRGVVLAKAVIDSTGHAGIAAAAGAPCKYTGPMHIALQGTGLPPRDLGVRYTNTDYTFIDDLDVFDTWRAFVTSKEKFSEAYDLGQLIDTRERRQVEGELFLTPLDAYMGRTFPDTIVMAESNFDTHGFTIHPMFMIRPPDRESVPTYVPYRCLLPKDLDGVLVTGLGVSAHRDVMPVIRMQPDIQNQGYAAGVAAAMAVQTKTELREIDIMQLQRHLVQKAILAPEVLSHEDSFPLPLDSVAEAVKTVLDGHKGLEVLFAQPEQALPLLRQAYTRVERDQDRFKYAHILALMGDPSGARDLAAAVRAKDWDEGWQYRGMGQFGPSMSSMDSLIIALGRTRIDYALEPILAKLGQLGSDQPFSHHRAVALALEMLNRAGAAQALAGLLAKPKMAGHAFTDIEVARANIQPSSTDNSTRESSLRELVLARALYRCGDHDGVGERILRAYARDLRGHYRRHAQAILAESRD